MLAYFDCVSGVSGDMTLGALVDAGLPIEDLQGEIDRLRLPGLSLRARSVKKNGFGATKVDVVTPACPPPGGGGAPRTPPLCRGPADHRIERPLGGGEG